jgi:hypothetical protein
LKIDDWNTGPGIKDEGLKNGQTGNDHQGGEEAEVHDAQGAPLPHLRPRAERVPEVRALPDLFSSERVGGIPAGRPEGFVVTR